MRRLKGRVALVTGAASGIGSATAVELAREGAAVALLDIEEKGLSAACEACAAHGVRVAAIACDVGDPNAVSAAFAAARRLGRIDAVFNNAGISIVKPLGQTTDADWARLLHANSTSCFNILREAAREMTAAARPAGPSSTQLAHPAIVNTASELALIGAPGYVAYAATKGAVIAMTRASAAELAPHGIRVNAVCPGETDTPMLRSEFALAADPTAERRAHERSIPLGRLATPCEIASAVVYLLSDESRYVTGTALVVDGGRTSCIALEPISGPLGAVLAGAGGVSGSPRR